MKITIVGTGYVGLVTGACLANTGNEVWCVDKNTEKIANLKNGIIPIYEPGLESLVLNGLKKETLFFTTEIAQAVKNASICFLCVDTPISEKGIPNLENVFAVSQSLGESLVTTCLIVTKSTVPVGTTHKVKEIIFSQLKKRGVATEGFFVASNPEFLREGSAVRGFQSPDRIVVGVKNPSEAEILRKLYEPFVSNLQSFLVMDIPSSEFAKYVANTMLASRISLMNELANLGEQVGVNIDCVREAIGWDHRIGPHFLSAGLGYGGSCLPKDVQALINLAQEKNMPLPLVSAIHQINQRQKELFLKKIVDHFGSVENLKDKMIAVWGLAFKPETDDTREAPAIFLIEKLLEYGAKIRAFDPVAVKKVQRHFENRVQFYGHYECLEGVDCLVIATEWSMFQSPDFDKMKRLMKNPLIFDGRNLYKTSTLKDHGFIYKGFCKASE